MVAFCFFGFCIVSGGGGGGLAAAMGLVAGVAARFEVQHLLRLWFPGSRRELLR
jgi:hypothetical protein